MRAGRLAPLALLAAIAGCGKPEPESSVTDFTLTEKRVEKLLRCLEQPDPNPCRHLFVTRRISGNVQETLTRWKQEAHAFAVKQGFSDLADFQRAYWRVKKGILQEGGADPRVEEERRVFMHDTTVIETLDLAEAVRAPLTDAESALCRAHLERFLAAHKRD